MLTPDDIKGYADNHAALNASINDLLATIMRPFHVLVEQEFDAPWNAERPKQR